MAFLLVGAAVRAITSHKRDDRRQQQQQQRQQQYYSQYPPQAGYGPGPQAPYGAGPAQPCNCYRDTCPSCSRYSNLSPREMRRELKREYKAERRALRRGGCGGRGADLYLQPVPQQLQGYVPGPAGWEEYQRPHPGQYQQPQGRPPMGYRSRSAEPDPGCERRRSLNEDHNFEGEAPPAYQERSPVKKRRSVEVLAELEG